MTPLSFGIITAMIFIFISIGWSVYYSMIKREFKRVNTELERHEEKIENTKDKFAKMQTDIALILQSIKTIEKILEKRGD